MKLLKAILILSALSLQAFAQDNQSMQTLRRQTSEEIRSTKRMSLALMPVGPGIGYRKGAGLGVSYFINANNLLELQVTSGHLNRTNFELYDSEIWARGAGFYYKYFPGNSFYLKTGLDYRDVDYRGAKRDYDSNFEYMEYRFAFQGNNWSATFSLGNQWQLGGFTIGADWFGVSVPFASKLTYESSEAVTLAQARAFEDDKFHYLNAVYGWATRFYLGVSF